MISLYKQKSVSDESVISSYREYASSDRIYDGSACHALGWELEKLTGALFGRLAGSCASAYRILLNTLGICKGEAVFLPSFSPSLPFLTVMECGASAFMVDCIDNTWCMDANALETAVKKCIAKNELYPRAVIAADVFGMPFDAAAIEAVCAKYGLILIEDIGQSLGATYNGKRAGSLGDAAIIDMTAPYGLCPIGNGGAIVGSNDTMSNVMLTSRFSGVRSNYETGAIEVVRDFTPSQMDEFTALLLTERLKNTDMEAALRKRRKNAERMIKAASDGCVSVQEKHKNVQGSYPVFALRARDKDSAGEITREFNSSDIECKMIYSKPLCRHPALKSLNCYESNVPIGSNLSVETFILPCREDLTEDEVQYICDKISEICK